MSTLIIAAVVIGLVLLVSGILYPGDDPGTVLAILVLSSVFVSAAAGAATAGRLLGAMP